MKLIIIITLIFLTMIAIDDLGGRYRAAEPIKKSDDSQK